MKVNVEELSPLERRLNIEVPPEEVSAAFDKIYQSLQRDVTIKGFRKGKAPMAQIKTMYADRVKGDVANQLVQDSYSKALDQNSLNPVNFPNIQISTLDEGKPFSFTAQFEVRPEIKLQQYTGLTVDKEELKIADDHVDKVIENIRANHSQRENVLEDRAAINGDIVIIDFEGFRNGQPVPNTKGDDFELELGSSSFIPGFEEGLVGTRVGQDRSLDLTFPENYHAKDLAGSAITFKTKVKALKKKTLPEINNEFAQKVGFEDVTKLREGILEDHKASEEKRLTEEYKNRLLKALVERNPVEVPKSMLEEQKQLLLNDVRGRLTQQGMGESEFQEYVQKWDKDLNESAAFMIQSSFLIHAIADKENLAATNEDLENKMAEYAKQTGIELSKLKGFYKENDNRSRLMYKITEDKVVDFLKSKTKGA